MAGELNVRHFMNEDPFARADIRVATRDGRPHKWSDDKAVIGTLYVRRRVFESSMAAGGTIELELPLTEDELRRLGNAATAAAEFLRRDRLGKCDNPHCDKTRDDTGSGYCGVECMEAYEGVESCGDFDAGPPARRS